MPIFCVLCLTWPALWNGYPIVFADTGTYLSQAMHRYLGWDRPVFYSLFIWPLHMGLTTWPVVVMQSCLTVFVLDLTRRAFDLAPKWLPLLTMFLTLATWLPWTVSELMPDLFTPLLILLLSFLSFSRPSSNLHAAVIGLTAFMIATQQSSIPLTIALLVIIVPLRYYAASPRPGIASLTPLLAPALAIIALVTVNTVGFGRVSLSPYGNVFVLARIIYDGPGMTVLRRDCGKMQWRLCPFLDRFPATVDEFLWEDGGPLMLAGGHKAVSADAGAIVRTAIASEPARLIAATLDNTIEQLTRFSSGDGLNEWNTLVGSWIDKDFPVREAAAFRTARQQQGTLTVPPLLMAVHRIVALSGIAAAAVMLPIAWRRRHVAAWYLLVALLALPLSAAVTGGLSSPHDRYQSRIAWLPACVAFLTFPVLLRRQSGIS